MSSILTIGGARAGDNVPLHWTPSLFLIAVAGAEMFVKSRSFLVRPATLSETLAAELERLATRAMQCAAPVLAANVVGSHVCVSVTSPCFRTNATGIVTGL